MNAKRGFKKVLIINNSSFNTSNATGITLRSTFQNWPMENIFEISCSAFSMGGEYRSFPLYTLPKRNYPFHYIMNSKLFKKANENSKAQSVKENTGEGNKNKFRKIVISYADMFPLFPPLQLLEKVKKFNPDCIYTMGGSILSMKLALYFSKKLDKKIVMHFMDNWQDTLYKDHLLMRPCDKKVQNLTNKIYQRMNVGLTISEKMAEEYTARRGIQHFPIMNSVSNIVDHPMVDVNKNDDFIITYAGGLHLQRWESLKDISEMISQLTNSNNKNIRLHIYTSEQDRHNYERYFDKQVVKFLEYLPHNKVHIAYSKADVLLHIESFDKQIMNFTKYSLSTKIPEYMSSGKPLLVYASRHLAVSQYVKENKVGLVCENKKDLYENIKAIIESGKLRYELAKEGINCAKQKHSADATTKILEKVFNYEDE
ncbi:glycosyltransferase [Sutcliffiella halmapala]